jgi:hypothetical protein
VTVPINPGENGDEVSEPAPIEPEMGPLPVD